MTPSPGRTMRPYLHGYIERPTMEESSYIHEDEYNFKRLHSAAAAGAPPHTPAPAPDDLVNDPLDRV